MSLILKRSRRKIVAIPLSLSKDAVTSRSHARRRYENGDFSMLA